MGPSPGAGIGGAFGGAGQGACGCAGHEDVPGDGQGEALGDGGWLLSAGGSVMALSVGVAAGDCTARW